MRVKQFLALLLVFVTVFLCGCGKTEAPSIMSEADLPQESGTTPEEITPAVEYNMEAVQKAAKEINLMISSFETFAGSPIDGEKAKWAIYENSKFMFGLLDYYISGTDIPAIPPEGLEHPYVKSVLDFNIAMFLYQGGAFKEAAYLFGLVVEADPTNTEAETYKEDCFTHFTPDDSDGSELTDEIFTSAYQHTYDEGTLPFVFQSVDMDRL